MKIIIAPAKKMRADIAWLQPQGIPCFVDQAYELQEILKQLDVAAIRKILDCSEKIAQEARQLYARMDVYAQGTPALLAYEGIQYRYMAPDVFEDAYFRYCQQHLRILSGLYGVLRPFDGIVSYRLELDSHVSPPRCHNLYAFWNDQIYRALTADDHELLDLASVQYSRVVTPYLQKQDRYVRCRFMEESDGTRKEKGVYVKIARGEMVRWLAEQHIEDIEEVKRFNRRGYGFDAAASSAKEFVFVRKQQGSVV